MAVGAGMLRRRRGRPGVARQPASPPRVVRLARYAVACVRSFHAQPAPRVLSWVTVKRCRPSLGRTYGHWWIELDDAESYGWWPGSRPAGLRALIVGTTGVLNAGNHAGRHRPIDPRHGDDADHAFHPVLSVRRSDWQVRRDLRVFATTFSGGWRWSLRRPSANCRSFQLALLSAAGLGEAAVDLHSRGRGCPILRPLRFGRCVARRGRGWGAVVHLPGGACGCPSLAIPPTPRR